MFISISSQFDTQSAPVGHRAVMLSTHCEIGIWEDIHKKPNGAALYEDLRQAAGNNLLTLARRVFPRLGKNALVYEIGTPRTYLKYTKRPGGEVGGVRLDKSNSNLFHTPHDIGIPGIRLAGDSTWPGVGTVACILGSKIVADQILQTI